MQDATNSGARRTFAVDGRLMRSECGSAAARDNRCQMLLGKLPKLRVIAVAVLFTGCGGSAAPSSARVIAVCKEANKEQSTVDRHFWDDVTPELATALIARATQESETVVATTIATLRRMPPEPRQVRALSVLARSARWRPSSTPCPARPPSGAIPAIWRSESWLRRRRCAARRRCH